MTTDQIYLKHEVEVLHRQFFQCDAPHGLIESYLKIHNELPDMASTSDIELRTVRVIIEKNLDAPGIEPWLRSRHERHILSRKLLLIAYLAECDAAHPNYRMGVEGRFHCLLYLGKNMTVAAFHLFRGRLQKAMYDLI